MSTENITKDQKYTTEPTDEVQVTIPIVVPALNYSEIPKEYDLVSDNDPILHKEAQYFDFADPPIHPVLLYRNMAKTLIRENGLGLAAPQCGLPYRFFVLRAEQIIGVFNPIIVDKSEEEIVLEEGCLSFKNLYIKIKRPKKIRVRYTTPDGNTATYVYDGMTARCFLHEYDHLEGILFKERANRFFLDAGLKKRKNIERGRLKVVPGKSMEHFASLLVKDYESKNTTTM